METSAEQKILQAQAQIAAGGLQAAMATLSQVLTDQPFNPSANALVGAIMLMCGHYQEAEQSLSQALKSDPALVAAATNLAIVFRRTNRTQKALELQRQIIIHDPSASNHYNLGNTLLELHAYEDAISAYKTALNIQPTHANALINMGRAYRMTLNLDECLECLRRAEEIDPTPASHSNLLFVSMFSPNIAAQEIAALAEQWDIKFGNRQQAERKPRSFTNAKRPDRILRIGYVAPTFRAHSAGFLIEPILERHDRQAFEVHCYSDVNQPDEITERLRTHANSFCDTVRFTDDELSDRIQKDGIDILVDLNLHMAGSRSQMFAKRAAPIQVNYLAYPFTSGLEAMDYRVTDNVLDPPNAKRYGPESLIRLTHCYWLYRPNSLVPQISSKLPAEVAGHMTFGCLNETRKLNLNVAQAWARILNDVPGSRLVLLSQDPQRQRPFVNGLVSLAGLDPDRIDLVGYQKHAMHFHRYSSIDICLDPFPYGGHTTALDTLWMGVPIVTLAGDAPYTRGAASMLKRIGLEHLVTDSIDEYVRVAKNLALDQGCLHEVRRDLRQRMQTSSTCDEKGFMTEYESMLRTAWRRYCEGQSAKDLDAISQL